MTFRFHHAMISGTRATTTAFDLRSYHEKPTDRFDGNCEKIASPAKSTEQVFRRSCSFQHAEDVAVVIRPYFGVATPGEQLDVLGMLF